MMHPCLFGGQKMDNKWIIKRPLRVHLEAALFILTERRQIAVHFYGHD
jgi:hypothetical protein